MLFKLGISLILIIHGAYSNEPQDGGSEQGGGDNGGDGGDDGGDGDAGNRNIFTMNLNPGQGQVFEIGDTTTPAYNTSESTTSMKTTQAVTHAAPINTQTTTTPSPSTPFQIPAHFTESYVDKFRQRLRLFTGELYHEILQLTPKDENIFFSPYSISHSLALINSGARGQSAVQIRETMKIEKSKENEINPMFKVIMDDKFSIKAKSDVVAKMAARSFIQENFSVKQDYIDSLMLYYNSGIEKMNFSEPSVAKERINTWVEETTNNLIKDLLPDGAITPLTRLVLVNTLYFKAPWISKFIELKSKKFQTPSGTVDAPYLYKKATFKVLETVNTIHVAVPYKDETTYFVITMPKNDKALEKFENKVNIKLYFLHLRKKLRSWKSQKITLFIPKFTVEQRLDLVEVLTGMGLTDIFSETTADLSGVSDTYLYVSDFLHKARITVNKEGTAAAAASAALMAARSLSKSVIIDRPFLFGVFEDDGDILFTGKIVNPIA